MELNFLHNNYITFEVQQLICLEIFSLIIRKFSLLAMEGSSDYEIVGELIKFRAIFAKFSCLYD